MLANGRLAAGMFFRRRLAGYIFISWPKHAWQALRVLDRVPVVWHDQFLTES
jgi:hypothetical protein